MSDLNRRAVSPVRWESSVEGAEEASITHGHSNEAFVAKIEQLDHGATRSHRGPVGPVQRLPNRYRVDGEIARGGMGAILRGRDTELDRDVALKVLLEDHGDRPDIILRFRTEAQVCGQLQHPGIVPVYDLGYGRDGKPYFTMKLIEGRTFAALLGERPTPADDLIHFITTFEHVCQAVAYAHSRGVIHRDLKPNNIMVGAFGEVQVMDWGIAKIIAQSDVSDGGASGSSPQRLPTAGEDSLQTQAGSILGTPSYMAPEQARGEVSTLDQRTDVFGLGAILCEILTGSPPYRAAGSSILLAAQTGDLTDAHSRLDACGADPLLTGLARRCLSSNAADRPPDARAVADAVTTYQRSVVQRLQESQLQQAQAQVHASEERKRRRLTVALAAALVGLITVAAGGGLYFQRQVSQRRAESERQETELRQAVDADLEKVADRRKEGRYSEARAVLEGVRGRVNDDAPEDVRQNLAQAEATLNLVVRLDEARLRKAFWTGIQFDYAGADRAYAEAFRDAGIGTEGEDAETVAGRVREAGVREDLVSALDSWAVGTRDKKRRDWLLAVARQADPDSSRNRLRDLAMRENRAALEKLAREVHVAEQSPQFLHALGVTLRLRGGDAVPLLSKSCDRYPNDFWLCFELGTCLVNAKKPDEAFGAYRAALASRPRTAAVYNNCGIILFNKGRYEDALAAFDKALELNPNYAESQTSRGLALEKIGRFDEGLAACRKAIDLEPLYAQGHYNLGTLLRGRGRGKEGCDAIAVASRLAPESAIMAYQLGEAFESEGRMEEAITAYSKASDLGHATSASLLGRALNGRGRSDEAFAAYRRAVALDPATSAAHNNMGLMLQAKGQLDLAIACFDKAVKASPEFAIVHFNRAIALDARGRLDEALAAYARTTFLAPKMAAGHGNLGVLLMDLGRYEEAEASLALASALGTNTGTFPGAQATLLFSRGRFEEARTSARRCLALLPKSHPGQVVAASLVRRCDALLGLEPNLAALATGKAILVTAAEKAEAAYYCQHRQYPRTAVRFYTEAFAEEPRLALNLTAGRKFLAACAAAAAATGQGKDVGEFEEKERAMLRRQAREWLSLELKEWGEIAARGPAPAKRATQLRMRSWQQEGKLAVLREPAARLHLPADEQAALTKLWADVAALVVATRE